MIKDLSYVFRLTSRTIWFGGMKCMEQYANLMAKLLTGRDLKYKNRNHEIKIPNSYQEKARFLRGCMWTLTRGENNSYVYTVFIGNEFVSMTASEYLNNRLDYINEKIQNNRLQLEFNWLKIVCEAIMIIGVVWGVLMWDCLLSKKENIIKKIIKSLGCLIAEAAYVFVFMVFIASLSVCSPLEILFCSLILSLCLSVNVFFTVRFWHEQKLNLCRKFEDKYQKIKDFINEYDLEDAKTQASESENIQQENNDPVPNQDNYEFIIFEDSRTETAL